MSISLIVFIVICFSAALAGGLVTRTSVKGWYSTIKKPSWNPPNWIFGPAWSLLYLMMAIAAWRVWQTPQGHGLTYPMVIFFIQLLLNTAWSFLFFGLRNPLLAFIDIVFLWGTIVLTLLSFKSIDPLAGRLFVPYILWVSFALILNGTIVKLNK